MVLDLRPFDIVEGVGFNELFIPVTNPFSNPNSFENPDKFENLEIFGYPSNLEAISCFRPDPIFRLLAHLHVISIFFKKIKLRMHG